MPRQPRIDIGGEIYHIINRSNARVKIFDNDKDFQLFEKLLQDAQEITDMRILAYCIMPNHFHLVLYPHNDGDLQEFMKWLTNAHTRKYHVQHKTIGSGHLYQGRYKSFLDQTDSYLLQLLKYVEQNALRAKLVTKAEDWKYSSLWRRKQGTVQQKKLLSKWPIDTPQNYLMWVNEQDDDMIEEIRGCISKGKPFGDIDWTLSTIDKYELFSTTRGSGRPRK
jgi:putative transposase